MPRLFQLPPREGRAWIALIASVGGAVALTLFSAWIVRLLATLPRTPETVPLVIAALARSNYGLLAIIGAILLSLGLAINRRSLRARAFGASLEADGGDEPTP